MMLNWDDLTARSLRNACQLKKIEIYRHERRMKKAKTKNNKPKQNRLYAET